LKKVIRWKLATTPAHIFVAAACEKTIRLLDPSTGRELARFPCSNPEAKNAWPLVALAAGKTNLLAAHRADGVISLWDVVERKQLMTFPAFTNNVSVLALSPDGNYLARQIAIASDFTARSWQFGTFPRRRSSRAWLGLTPSRTAFRP
jgi:WD40 repeat protein